MIIIFDPDFFLWIIINYRNGNYELDENMRIDFFTDLSTTGKDIDYIGQKVITRKSRDVTLSIPMLLTIISGKEPKNCKFAFSIDGYAGTIEANSEGPLSILHSIGVFNLVSPLERIVIGIHFILRFKQLYDKWLNLNSNEKYPSTEDFLNIIADCHDKDARFYNINDVIKKYKKKRKTGG